MPGTYMQRARDAEGPLLHGLRHRGLHGLELRGSRRAVLLTDDQLRTPPAPTKVARLTAVPRRSELLEVPGQRGEGRRHP